MELRVTADTDFPAQDSDGLAGLHGGAMTTLVAIPIVTQPATRIAILNRDVLSYPGRDLASQPRYPSQ